MAYSVPFAFSWDTQILDQCPVIVWFSLAIFKESATNGFLVLKLKALHPEYFHIVFSVRIITVATVYFGAWGSTVCY